MDGDAYLTIAERVLEASRCPLSSTEIFNRALIMGVVPGHLHGKTQYKTLTARISEDILKYRDKSRFFRPYPGRYFLTRFLSDITLPDEYRRPFTASRRSRQLKQEYSAYVDQKELKVSSDLGLIEKNEFARLVRNNLLRYDQRGRPQDCGVPLWHFSAVRRGNEILTYRRGRYLDGRQITGQGRTTGFAAPLSYKDRTLFDQRYHGVLGAALATVAVDLDLEQSKTFQDIERRSKFVGGVYVEGGALSPILLVCQIRVPKEYQIETRRLAIRGLEWISYHDYLRRLYNFDVWSQRAAFLLR